ncbi:phaC PHA synthase [Vibrio sp. SCSIO 43136]|uniref:VC2662 family protein n=1 Tax=Vibrio sp. SCSIO 43136 TaxID=2819101 RepID=UPI0020761E75|nr:phaC PHA synthase [Vibrio sp. SCSIO 43136]USD65089.1 phaC PHA synthase [Vibrio sp. SCSIO 43136]
MKKVLFTTLMAASLAAPVAMADSSGAMFSTLEGNNVPSNDAVGGVRLSVLHGKVSEVKGVDVSLLGMSETDKTTGLNFGLFFGGSKVNQEMKGVSLGLFNWNEGQAKGLNAGLVNYTNDVKGLNLSTVNYSQGHTMADVALVSISEKSNFQFGFFNKTKQIEGVQIGLLNCADNGFFKCFPIVNFAK